MKTINVVHIHGIGGDKKNSHEKIIKNIKKKLGDNVALRVYAVNYLKDINKYQDENFKRMLKSKGGKYMRIFKSIRRLFLNSFGDALTIYADRQIYNKVMSEIRSVFSSTSVNNYPTVVITHSLGCQLFSCYMWDEQGKKNNVNGKIRAWFSTGNNMRGFFSGKYFLNIIPFKKPNHKFTWHNFFSWSDLLLGYHMTGINPKYDILLTSDTHVKGIPFLSHSAYSKSKKVVKKIAQEINKI